MAHYLLQKYFNMNFKEELKKHPMYVPNNYTALLKDTKYSIDHLNNMARRWVNTYRDYEEFVYSPTATYPPNPSQRNYAGVYVFWVMSTIKYNKDRWGNTYRYTEYRYYDTEELLKGFRMLHQLG